MFSFLIILQLSSADDCTVEGCCEHVIGTCHVNHTTGSGNSCECVCEDGWFKLSNTSSFYSSTLCAFCSGHGLSFNTTTRGCSCTNHWTGVLFGCSHCEDPYGGEECDRCSDAYNQSSYPDCDVCADGYFYDPSHDETDRASPSSACLSYDECTTEYCSGTSADAEGVANASIVNETCQCECNAGWFGEFSSILGNPHLWQACFYCNGHGTSFNGNDTCLDCQDEWDPNTDCMYCSFPYDTLTCDQCAKPSGNQRFTPYPECHEYFKSSFDSATFFGIFFSCGFIAFAVSYVVCRKLLNKEHRFQQATERISRLQREAAYHAMNPDEKASEVSSDIKKQGLLTISEGANTNITVTLDDIEKA